MAVVENSSNNISERVPLNTGDKDYQGKIKFEQPGTYSVYVLAEGKALTRKSGPQTIRITEKNGLVKGIWLGILAATALVILLLKGIRKIIENAKPKLFLGKIKLRVINTATGMEEMRQSKPLTPYGTSVTLSVLAENPASALNTVILVRNTQGVNLTCLEAGSEDLLVSVNGDKVAPGQRVPLTNGCFLRVVAVVDSIKVEGQFSAF